MFVSFKAYVETYKYFFSMKRYTEDIQYRAVVFNQFGESFRLYCEDNKIANDYEEIAYEVTLYEKRLEYFRNS